MSVLVADTSALVSLGVVATTDPNPFAMSLTRYHVVVPAAVVDELREIASFDDTHGRAATTILSRTDRFDVRPVDLDAAFPLDEGENAAVTLANELDAAVLLCDEFNQIGLIHASLADTRLVTTPTLLSVFVREKQLSGDEASSLLDAISAARSWGANSYVQRAYEVLDQS